MAQNAPPPAMMSAGLYAQEFFKEVCLFCFMHYRVAGELIGISAWSFKKRFFKRTMGYPQFFAAVRGLGVSIVELNSPFFGSLEEDCLRTIRTAAENYGIRIKNIAVDDPGFDLSSLDEANRKEAVRRTTAWLDAAVFLDCPHVRGNTGGTDFSKCVESFTALAAQASARNRSILIEPHDGFSADAEKIIPLIRTVRERFPDSIGLVPDFGNVAVTQTCDRYQQIGAMAPYAMLVHAKMHDFDEHGRQPEWDTARLIHIMRSAGFQGPWMIEFEGRRDEDFVGVKKSIALLSRCLED